MHVKRFAGSMLPIRSGLVTWFEIVETTGVHPSFLSELVDLGWLDPVRTGSDEYLFRKSDVLRIRKITRICADLGISSLAGSIIVDLTERVEHLEKRVRELERLL